jgi:CheY-like chemotaxis protein
MPKILVVMDDESSQYLIDALLSLNGYHVILAKSVQNALEIFRRVSPDVMVLDLNMPEMDGVKVVRQVRRLNPRQPMIILTGDMTSEKEQRVCALGVNEVIEKGVAPRRLVSVLRRLIRAPGPIPFPARTRTLQLNRGEWRIIS